MATSTTKNISNRGLSVVEHGNALTIDPNQLEATRNFFYSNGFNLNVVGPELHLLFVQSSRFLKGNRITMAIEVIMPLSLAAQGFFNSIFVEPSTTGTQTFFETIASNNEKAAQVVGKTSVSSKIEEIEDFEPSSNNFRQVPANYSRFAYASTEGMIEFYEGNPIFIHSLTTKRATRQNDGIHSVFAVICSTQMLEELLLELKKVLEPLNKKMKQEE